MKHFPFEIFPLQVPLFKHGISVQREIDNPLFQLQDASGIVMNKRSTAGFWMTSNLWF